MNAGYGLDLLVARNVMVHHSGQHVPPYSTDIGAAWVVAEKKEIGVLPWGDPDDGKWVAGYEVPNTSVCWYERVLYGAQGGAPASWAFADTAPHAICLAALKAVGAGISA